MLYLASPYTHSDPLIVKTRFLLAEQVTANLLERGYFIYSPIVHCHALAEKYALPSDFTFWKQYNFDFIRRSDQFLILNIPGWEESKGVTAERDFARECGIEIGFVDEHGNMTWHE